MSTNYSPKIVTNGLSLCLDVSNQKSYSGSAPIWLDMAQSLTFSSAGTQTPVATVNGVKSLAANGGGYWICSSGYSNVDFGGDCTLILWIYAVPPTLRTNIFEKRGNTYASYEQEISVTWETANNFSYYSRQGVYDYGGTATFNSSQWNMVGIKMSTGKTAAARTGFNSLNGSPWVSAYTSRSSTPLVASSDIVIFNGYAGTLTNSNLGMVLAYNKMLTDNEILQNFNATRGRFGI